MFETFKKREKCCIRIFKIYKKYIYIKILHDVYHTKYIFYDT